MPMGRNRLVPSQRSTSQPMPPQAITPDSSRPMMVQATSDPPGPSRLLLLPGADPMGWANIPEPSRRWGGKRQAVDGSAGTGRSRELLLPGLLLLGRGHVGRPGARGDPQLRDQEDAGAGHRRQRKGGAVERGGVAQQEQRGADADDLDDVGAERGRQHELVGDP